MSPGTPVSALYAARVARFTSLRMRVRMRSVGRRAAEEVVAAASLQVVIHVIHVIHRARETRHQVNRSAIENQPFSTSFVHCCPYTLRLD